MIRLHPMPDVTFDCPYCQLPLTVTGWYMPGMRTLATLRCPRCSRDFYGDLPVGHGIRHGYLLDKATGQIHGEAPGHNWYAGWLRRSYARRTQNPRPVQMETFRTPRRGVLLNCLDAVYGHGLLKLLNAQYYLDHCPDLDLVVLIQPMFRWLVPDGVAAIWTVDLSLGAGIEWNDWLAAEFRKQVETWDEAYLSRAFSHPHPADFHIQRFTRVMPFPLAEWEERLRRPTVTYIWREDRLWSREPIQRFLRRAQNFLIRHGILAGPAPWTFWEQTRAVVALARRLRQRFPQLDFAVAGVGQAGGLPAWIQDLRTRRFDESLERALVARYAASHVVVGVPGSNMLLPSAHAGATVELMPEKRWGNMLQDLLVRLDDMRETLFHYRILPVTTSPDTVSDVIGSVLADRAPMLAHMARASCQHHCIRSDGNRV